METVTETVCGLFVTPGALEATGTEAVYVPADIDAVFTESESVAGAAVEFSDGVSHPERDPP